MLSGQLLLSEEKLRADCLDNNVFSNRAALSDLLDLGRYIW